VAGGGGANKISTMTAAISGVTETFNQSQDVMTKLFHRIFSTVYYFFSHFESYNHEYTVNIFIVNFTSNFTDRQRQIIRINMRSSLEG